MSEWTMKRFWSRAEVAEGEDGFAVTLDGRSVRTPAKAPLVVPTRALAEAVAAEWDAQVETVDPATMPVTRTINSAIDTVAPQEDAVRAMLGAYGETDLLCYRADGPAALVARQAELWDPMLDWAAETHGAHLRVTSGVMPIAQEARAVAKLATPMETMSPFELAAFHDLVALTGSLVLGLAAADGAYGPDAIWALSRLDEEWQAEEWGRDDEADAAAARKHADFRHAHAFLGLARAAN